MLNHPFYIEKYKFVITGVVTITNYIPLYFIFYSNYSKEILSLIILICFPISIAGFDSIGWSLPNFLVHQDSYAFICGFIRCCANTAYALYPVIFSKVNLFILF